MKIAGTAAANVAERLLIDGPQTAVQLAKVLKLTGTAVRRQLDLLELDGFVESSERAPYGPGALDHTRGRGRPARIFSLTPAGRAEFGQQQDSVSLSAVRFIEELAGADGVRQFAHSLIADFEARHQNLLDLPVGEERAHALIDALNEDGFAASAQTGLGHSTQICQHNCPMGDLATEYPVVCEVETEIFSELTGVHVTRLATIAKGDAVCTTLVPHTRREMS